MSDIIKKRRKTPSKFLRLDEVEEEYSVVLDDILELLKDGYLEAFGLFDNDFTAPTHNDHRRELDIASGTWRGNHNWYFNAQRFELINDESLQSFSEIRLKRKKFDKIILKHYDPNKINARIYNWELIITEICIYLHGVDVPKTKKAWFKQIFDTIPYFQTGPKPDNRTMSKHLDTIWQGLNQSKNILNQ